MKIANINTNVNINTEYEQLNIRKRSFAETLQNELIKNDIKIRDMKSIPSMGDIRYDYDNDCRKYDS